MAVGGTEVLFIEFGGELPTAVIAFTHSIHQYIERMCGGQDLGGRTVATFPRVA